jgi:hypothetical protein
LATRNVLELCRDLIEYALIHSEGTHSVWKRLCSGANAAWRRLSSDLGLWLFLFLACGARAAAGLHFVNRYAQDLFIFTDGAWRFANGQRTHVDFYSGLGPLQFLISWAGMAIAHGQANGVGYGQAIAGGVVGLWTWWLTRNRLGRAARFAFVVLNASLSLAPNMLGLGVRFLGPAMQFNRYGSSLLLLVLLECAVSPRADATTGRTRDLAGPLSTGMAWALTFFLKMSFFVVAIPMLAAFAILRPRPWRDFFSIAAGVLIPFSLFAVYFHGDFLPMLRDQQMVLAARHAVPDISRDALLGTLPLNGFFFLGALPLVVWIWRNHGILEGLRVGAETLVVLACSMVVTMSNSNGPAIPLLIGFSIAIFFDFLRLPQWRDTFSNQLLHATLAAALAIPFAMQVLPDLTLLGYATFAPMHSDLAVQRTVDSPVFAGMVFRETHYIDTINDGLALIRRNSSPNEAVLAFDYIQPFAQALQRPVVRGGSSGMDFDYTFSDKVHLTPERLFGEVPVVIETKKSIAVGTEVALNRIYGPFLHQHYRMVDETQYWKLWRRID